MNCSDRQILDVLDSGKHKCTAILSSANVANQVVVMPRLKDIDLVAYIPEASLNSEGTIKCVPHDITLGEIMLHLATPGTMLLQTRRLNRKATVDGEAKLIPTQTVYLKFESRIRPDTVSLFYVRHQHKPYCNPVKICFCCFRFNHPASQYKSHPKALAVGRKNTRTVWPVLKKICLLFAPSVRDPIFLSTKYAQLFYTKNQFVPPPLIKTSPTSNPDGFRRFDGIDYKFDRNGTFVGFWCWP